MSIPFPSDFASRNCSATPSVSDILLRISGIRLPEGEARRVLDAIERAVGRLASRRSSRSGFSRGADTANGKRAKRNNYFQAGPNFP
ncbi:MAG TPA: hypothetical protein VKG25_23810 [Bryobacteraceae bacterium]|nr:hypothetical protein [Bryobacteraceae bacterium]